METVSVGHGRECITPPLGIRMVGYASRTEGAADVHDDLFVNAVVIEHGDERVAMLTYDVCLLSLGQADEFKAAIQDATGLGHRHAERGRRRQAGALPRIRNEGC